MTIITETVCHSEVMTLMKLLAKYDEKILLCIYTVSARKVEHEWVAVNGAGGVTCATTIDTVVCCCRADQTQTTSHHLH